MSERTSILQADGSFEIPPVDVLLHDGEVRSEVLETSDRTYFDTADLRLARWGVFLLRGADGWELSFGSNGTDQHFDGGARRPPAEAVDLVTAFSRGEQLRPAGRLRVSTTTLRLSSAEAKLEVEDRRSAVLEGTKVADRIREVCVTGTADAVSAAASELRTAGATDADDVPAAVRALGERSREAPDVPEIELPGEPSAGEVVVAEFAGAVRRIVEEDHAIRLGRHEPIHKARVSARRMHSQLRTFRPLFDEAAVEQLRTELRWLVDTLGVPRDLDVTLDRLREGAPMVGPASSRRLQMAIQALEEARAKATEDLLSDLRGARYVQLLDLLVDTIAAPPLTARAETPALGVLPAMVHREWTRLRKKQRRLGRPPSHRDLHKMRIAVKRVRYAAEATEPIVGKRAHSFAKTAAALQDALGDACDAVLAEEWLRRWMGQDQLRPETVTAPPDGEPWRAAWDALDRKRLRSWMTATIDDR